MKASLFPARSGYLLGGAALVAAAVLVIYAPAINGKFLLDDEALLPKNELILPHEGLYLIWCTTEPVDYWPVTNTALWIEWRLWGACTAGYHSVNLILRIAEALLVWIVLLKMSIPGAFLAGVLFAVHPVNVESVAWIAQQKNMLAMLFFLLSILCYLKHLKQLDASPIPHPSSLIPDPSSFIIHHSSFSRSYWLSLAAFLLAILGKGSVAVLPVLLLGIVWWQRPVTRRDLLQIAPFFLIAAALAVVNMWFRTHGSETVFRAAGPTERLLGAGAVLWFYLEKAVLPVNLSFIYPQWEIRTGDFMWCVPLAAAIAVTILLWLFRNSWGRPLLFAWAFFCVALIPVLGIIDVGFMQYSLVADHYAHIAIIAIVALAAAGWATWRLRSAPTASLRGVPAGAAIAALGVLSFLAWRQASLYRDPMTLYEATLQANPQCWMAHNNLSAMMIDLGRLDDAMEHCRKALAIKPDDCEAQNNIGLILAKKKRPEEAIDYYRRSLAIKPSYAEAHANLGNALIQLSRRQEAIEEYQRALQSNPALLEPRYNLAVTLLQSGRTAEAVEQFRRALDFKRDFFEAHVSLGNALLQTGRPQEAVAHFLDAVSLKPAFANVYLNLASAYSQTNRAAEAVAAVQKALELARSQGQTEMAREVEEWLKSHQPGMPDVRK